MRHANERHLSLMPLRGFASNEVHSLNDSHLRRSCTPFHDFLHCNMVWAQKSGGVVRLITCGDSYAGQGPLFQSRRRRRWM